MRLLSLTANKESFRSIQFNENGISIILGKRKASNSIDLDKTYNGVGKSLSLILVHFCLGSSNNDAFESSLTGWVFTLKVKIGEEILKISRSTDDQNTIRVNDKEYSKPKFRKFLRSKVFPSEQEIKGLKFRPLIKRFYRPRKASYNNFDSTHNREYGYNKLICNSYLLGFNTSLVVEKRRLKKEKDKVKDLKSNIEKDEIFQEYFSGDQDIDIQLKDLNEQIEELEEDIEEFEIAEDYHEVERRADKLKRDLQKYRNQATLLRNSISNLNDSLEQRPDISTEKLEAVYEEVGLRMPEKLVKDFSEVTRFHEDLIKKREARLQKERSKKLEKLEEIEKAINEYNKEFDSKLQYLGAHGALDELVQLNKYLSDLKSQANKIRDYKNLLANYDRQIQDYDIELSQQNTITADYLDEIREHRNKILETFRNFSKEFYPDKPGGLLVKNNDGINQTRFNIEASIEDDSSDGINEVKIFCFDMTVLALQENHKMKSVFHDSRLISDIDPRQRATLFKVANSITLENDFQYIISANEDQLEVLEDYLGPEDYTDTIQNNIVLELTDDSPEGKLLGIQVDLDY